MKHRAWQARPGPLPPLSVTLLGAQPCSSAHVASASAGGWPRGGAWLLAMGLHRRSRQQRPEEAPVCVRVPFAAVELQIEKLCAGLGFSPLPLSSAVAALLPGTLKLAFGLPSARRLQLGQRRRTGAWRFHAGPWPHCLCKPSTEGSLSPLEGPALAPRYPHVAVTCVPRGASPVSPDLLQGPSPPSPSEHPLSSA